MGLHQSNELMGGWNDSGGAEVLYSFIGVGLGLVVGLGEL